MKGLLQVQLEIVKMFSRLATRLDDDGVDAYNKLYEEMQEEVQRMKNYFDN